MFRKIYMYLICVPVTLIGLPSHGKLQSDCIRTVASIHPWLPNIIAQIRSRVLFRKNPYRLESKISLELLKCDLTRVRKEVQENGYSIIENALSPQKLLSLKSEILKIHVHERVSSGGNFVGALSEATTLVGRYDLLPEDLLKSSEIRGLAFSKDWLQVGSFVMGQPVVFDGVNSWWMFESDPKFASLNAQAFHSDRERLSFLKFFFYLTDIDENTGPHVYADGTHKSRPIKFRGDRRYSDDELRTKGIDFTPIYGLAGTVIVANTQGLHKGVPPNLPNHGRLLFEIQVADSLQGMRRREINIENWSPSEVALLKQGRYFRGIKLV